MMKKTIITIAISSVLAGCGTIGNAVRSFDDPVVYTPKLKTEPEIKEPASGPIAVAVYNFRDMTGQRKASQTIATLSSAVTQGADAYLVKSLQEVGGGRWFKVLERGGLDNLVKERQLIRQMRELYQGKDAQPLPPMMFAGMILEGGIIGYDSNTLSGGSGARILGIGGSTEYRQDEVTISLRAVSVGTGEVLATVTTTKTVLSFQDKVGVLRFYDAGTKSFEAESGAATNESMNKAVQLAIHGAVIQLIQEGARKGHWGFKVEQPAPGVTVELTPAPTPEVKVEPRVEPKAEPAPEVKVEPKPEPVVVAPTTSRVETVATKPVVRGVVLDWANVRKNADMQSPKLMKLEPNREIVIIRKEGSFYEIDASGTQGWVPVKLIKKVE